jgi:hypothetical protein
VRFGSLWTNITKEMFKKLDIESGNMVAITIRHNSEILYHHRVLYGHSFADACIGEPVLYINSLNRMGLAINQGSFAKAYDIGTGNHWKLTIHGSTST